MPLTIKSRGLLLYNIIENYESVHRVTKFNISRLGYIIGRKLNKLYKLPSSPNKKQNCVFFLISNNLYQESNFITMVI